MRDTIELTDELTRQLAAMFKAVPVSALKQGAGTASTLECAQSGFVAVRDGNPIALPAKLFDILNQTYGVNTAGYNATFHKSFGTVADLSPEVYFYHQILHYFTTYGAKAVGVSVPTYVPAEELRLPKGMLPVDRLTVLQVLPDDVLVTRVNHFAETVKAPNERQKEAMRLFLPYVTVETENMASFEFQIMAHDYRGTVPEQPVSVLRYLIYKTTGETLLIKSPKLIKAICEAGESADGTAQRILMRADKVALSEIFLRYKPIFLAYKKYPGCSPIINRIRRLAIQHHKPLPDEAFQNVIQLALAGRNDAVERLLNKAENRELIKLINAVMLRCFALTGKPGVYMVRNGRIFVRAGALKAATRLEKGAAETLSSLFNRAMKRLTERLRPTVEGRTFFIPGYISYAAPYSEKQMMGHIPYGTKVMTDLKGAFTAGIHWYNADDDMTDLDLHMRSKTRHFGWNADYLLENRVIFTGDQTDAPQPDGAAEAFYFEPEAEEVYILSANNYSGQEKVRFEFAVTTQKPTEEDLRSENFTFDPSKIAFAPIPLQFNGFSDMTIGMFVGNVFYIYGGILGDGIVPRENSVDLIDGMQHILEQRIQLTEILNGAGGQVINDMSALQEGIDETDVVNLSPQAITSELLFSLIDGTYGEKDAAE